MRCRSVLSSTTKFTDKPASAAARLAFSIPAVAKVDAGHLESVLREEDRVGACSAAEVDRSTGSQGAVLDESHLLLPRPDLLRRPEVPDMIS